MREYLMRTATTVAVLFLSAAAFAEGPVTEGQFIAHEWGTFTAVQGSNGQALGGMSHEEEHLPAFAGGRDLLIERPQRKCPITKGMPICDDGVLGPVIHSVDVTQKMETPVLYFHSDRQRQVAVDIGFPGGIISQYFPRPSSFSPEIGKAFSLSGGHVSFRVNVVNGELPVPDVDPANVYSPARNVTANYIQSGNENEKFIFYRGLGNFTTTLSVTSQNGDLELFNRGLERIADVFLINVSANGSGFVQALGGMDEKGPRTVSNADLSRLLKSQVPAERFLSNAQSQLNAALVRSGLYKDEAMAMTNTWKNSYFRNPGLRVLYVLSRAETERLLPMNIQPAPQELVRTMVGRIEVLTDLEERSLLADLESGTIVDTATLGRFAEPKLRRLLQLTTNPQLVDRIKSLIP